MFSKISFLIIAAIAIQSAKAQSFDLSENSPVTDNGIEYGFIIKNEQIKESKGEEYSRYEIRFYITNKSGCTKIYSDRSSLYSGESPNLLATFNCLNANGKRFTSKSGSIKARDFYINAKKIVDKKEVTETVKAGYIFRNGETLNDNIIVLVPKGERPVITVMGNTPPELQ